MPVNEPVRTWLRIEGLSVLLLSAILYWVLGTKLVAIFPALERGCGGGMVSMDGRVRLCADLDRAHRDGPSTRLRTEIPNGIQEHAFVARCVNRLSELCSGFM